MWETFAKLDRELFLLLNGMHSSFWDPIMDAVSGKKIWIPFYALIIALWAYTFRKNVWRSLLAIALIITLADRFASGFMKPFVGRLRPCRDPELADLVHNLGSCGKYGFISSHAANTFALAMFFVLLYGKKHKASYLIFLWAGIVSYSRIYLGVHYPGDIVCGALSGIFWAWLVWFIGKKIWPDSGFEALVSEPKRGI